MPSPARDQSRAQVVTFGGQRVYMSHVLGALLHNLAWISGVTKGRGLEQRVMELTD